MATVQTATPLHQFWRLTEEKRQLNARVDEINGELAVLQEQILNTFAAEGVASVKINDPLTGGGATLFLHKMLWARAIDGDQARACAALKANGLADFVKESFNTQTLSAYLREQEKEGRALPEPVVAVLDVRTEYSVRARRA